MININKKKRGAFMGVVLLLSLLAFFLYNGFSVEASGTVIVVNPGHLDGVDSGAVNSSNGIREVDLNNALAIKIVSTLRSSGYNAMLSHPIPGNPGLPTLLSSNPEYNVYSTTICNKANEVGADLLLSVHHNSGGNSSGYELYWSSYHPTVDNNGIFEASGLWSGGVTADLDSSPPEIALLSRDLANSLNENFKNLGYVPSRNRVIERDDAITRKTSMPSVLIEAGFVSNSVESLAMANSANQQKMADQVLVSVDELFGVDNTPMTATNVSGSVSGNKITVTLTGVTAPAGVKAIQVPVWSQVNGQDDIAWYTATKQINGSYSVTLDIKDHNYDGGTYNIHGYGTDNRNKMVFLGNTTVDVKVEPMTAKSVNASISDNKITVTLTGITAPNGIKTIQIPVWSEVNGQDDIGWYTATKQIDGSYSMTLDIKDHNYDGGKYNIHVYGTDNNNRMMFLGNTTVNVNVEQMAAKSVVAIISGDKITVTLTGITAPAGVKTIQVPVWSEVNGQDDIGWYTAIKKIDGSYSVTLDIKDHNYDGGTYNIHGYGTDNRNKMVFLGNTTVDVKVEPMTAKSVNASISDNKITVTLTGITAPNGIKTILIPVWSEVNGQDDIGWYTAIKKIDGSYSVTLDIKDHNYDGGTYDIHGYGIDNRNKMVFLGNTTVDVKTDPMTATSVVGSVSGNTITATINGITSPNGVKTIQVPVWSEINGQDDIRWYTATKKIDGSYSVTFDIKDHNYDGGTYDIHGYGIDNRNKMVFLGNTTVDVKTDPMTATSVVGSVSGNTITATINGITAPNGVKMIQVPVWSEINGQDDIGWYTAIKQNNGCYTVTLDIKDHNYNEGTYNIHSYGIDNNNKMTFLGNATVNVEKANTVLTPIMGTSTVEADQLVLYYQNKNITFPQYYSDRGVDLQRFAEIYIEEANAEGVRAEVAFSQAMLETGFLKFGGDVKIDQFNFAGLGATGGVPGNSFVKYGDNETGIRMGIRAHIQHLKCYASIEQLNLDKVDERFYDSIRGKAPYVEWLGIPDNPYGNGTGWAAATNYGSRIIAMMNQF